MPLACTNCTPLLLLPQYSVTKPEALNSLRQNWAAFLPQLIHNITATKANVAVLQDRAHSYKGMREVLGKVC